MFQTPTSPISTELDWEQVLKDLNYLSSHADILERRFPNLDLNQLVRIEGDLASLLQDVTPFNSETNLETAEQL